MQRRKRVRINARNQDLWEPQWNDEIIGWTRKFIYNNKWRTPTYHDEEDLLQDAYLLFMKLRDMYPTVVEPQHFMQMYKTAVWRSFMDKGRKLKNDILSTRQATVEAKLPQSVIYNDGPMNALLKSGPPELKLLLEFINDDSNLAKLREPQRARANSDPRMNMDQRLSSLLGIPYFPFRETLRRWLFA